MTESKYNALSQEDRARLEERFINDQKDIYNSIHDYLKAVHEDRLSIDEIFASDLNKENFKYYGSALFMVGLDFMNNPPSKKIMENVHTRLNEVLPDFSEEEKKAYYTILIQNVDRFDLAEFKEMLTKYETAVDAVIPQAIEWSKIEWNAKKLFSNSYTPVKFVIDLCELLDKSPDSITYRDVLKLNSTISEHISFIGEKAITAFGKIYSNAEFTNLLKISVQNFDMYKYGNIYYEMILTFKEYLQKYGNAQTISLLTGTTTDEEFAAFEAAAPVPDQTTPNPVSDKYSGAMDEIMKNDPINALFIILHEAVGGDTFTQDQFFEGIESILQNPDYFADVYKYIKAAYGKLTGTETQGEYAFDIPALLSALTEKNKQLKEEYKIVAENICQELVSEQAKLSNQKIVEVIKNMVMSNPTERQHFISLYYDQNLTTVQHIIQIMQFIENSYVMASSDSLKAYKALYQYLQSEFKDQFSKVSEADNIFQKISFYLAITQLIDKWQKLLNKEEKE
jgi:hypothetical protein